MAVRPLTNEAFVTSEVYIRPDWIITAFGERDWESVAPILAEQFVGGRTEMGTEEMIADLEDHYGMFDPQDCRIEDLSVEDNGTVVYRAIHVERHENVYLGVEPTGNDIAYGELGVLRFEDGSIRERRVSWDLDQFHVQLGIRPGRRQMPISKRGTQVKVQQQFYRVLNRLLRHNIRNDLTYVRGYAETLAGRENDAAEQAGGIVDFADDLLDTAEKVRVLEERVLKPGQDRETDVVDVAESVAIEYRREFPNADIDVDVSVDRPMIETNRPILEVVLRETVENALTHNDADRPSVVLGIEPLGDEDYALEVAVVDDGPGIPEHELTPLNRDRETDLEHSSGIGLWAIKWGVEQLGGEVVFEENDPEGTVVRLPLVDFGDPSSDGE